MDSTTQGEGGGSMIEEEPQVGHCKTLLPDGRLQLVTHICSSSSGFQTVIKYSSSSPSADDQFKVMTTTTTTSAPATTITEAAALRRRGSTTFQSNEPVSTTSSSRRRLMTTPQPEKVQEISTTNGTRLISIMKTSSRRPTTTPPPHRFSSVDKIISNWENCNTNWAMCNNTNNKWVQVGRSTAIHKWDDSYHTTVINQWQTVLCDVHILASVACSFCRDYVHDRSSRLCVHRVNKDPFVAEFWTIEIRSSGLLEIPKRNKKENVFYFFFFYFIHNNGRPSMIYSYTDQ